MAIINCPECHNEVSDMAPICPHCGVKIDGNIIICPDCGKVLLKKETRCPNCGCQFEGMVHPISSEERDIKVYPEYKYTEHHYKKTIGYVLISVLLLALIAGCYYVISIYKNTEAMEHSYASLANCKEQDSLKIFMEQYPNSPYIEDIQKRLIVLKDIESKWISIADSTQKDLFVKFLKDYPNSYYEDVCNDKIDSLDWVTAGLENTADSYQYYLEMHPDGKYKKMCEDAKSVIEKATASYPEITAVREVLNAYFEAVSANNADGVQACTNERTYGQTMEFMRQLHGSYSKVLFSIQNAPFVSRAPITDSTFNYVAKFKVLRTLTTGVGETFNEGYNASYMVNKDKRIISIYMGKTHNVDTE